MADDLRARGEIGPSGEVMKLPQQFGDADQTGAGAYCHLTLGLPWDRAVNPGQHLAAFVVASQYARCVWPARIVEVP